MNKQQIKCEHDWEVDWSTCLTSNPPQYRGTCQKCGEVETRQLVDWQEDTLSAFSGVFTIERAFITAGDVTIGNRVLKPKPDLTPIELWNIWQFIETCKMNSDSEQLWEYAQQLEIDRHFEVRV